MRELVDQLHDVVFEELLLARIEELDRLLAVGGVGAGEPEVELACRLVADRRAVHAELRGAVLVVGERLRVDDVQVHLAAGARRQLLEEVPHAHAVGASAAGSVRAVFAEKKKYRLIGSLMLCRIRSVPGAMV